MDQTWLLSWGYFYLGLSLIGVAFLGMFIERAWPNVDWPKTPNWELRAWLSKLWLVVLIMGTGVTIGGPLVEHRFYDASALGTVVGGIWAYLVYSFVFYWWHWVRHKPLLWRYMHQFHHSPQRIETITTFYKNPIEQAIDVVFATSCIYLLGGANVGQALVATFLVGFIETIYHVNIKTPQWFGYIIQRPESHFIHHQTGVQSYNFGDLAIYDIMFGTFRNPKYWHGSCGFTTKEEMEIGPMIAGVDVSEMPVQADFPRLIAEATSPP